MRREDSAVAHNESAVFVQSFLSGDRRHMTPAADLRIPVHCGTIDIPLIRCPLRVLCTSDEGLRLTMLRPLSTHLFLPTAPGLPVPATPAPLLQEEIAQECHEDPRKLR